MFLSKLDWSRDVTGKVDNIHSNLTPTAVLLWNRDGSRAAYAAAVRPIAQRSEIKSSSFAEQCSCSMENETTS